MEPHTELMLILRDAEYALLYVDPSVMTVVTVFPLVPLRSVSVLKGAVFIEHNRLKMESVGVESRDPLVVILDLVRLRSNLLPPRTQ